MNKIRWINFIFVLIMSFLISWAGGSAQTDLKKTHITPHMEVPIQSGQNLVYCSTFQIAWNKLKDDIIQEDIKARGPIPEFKLLVFNRPFLLYIKRQNGEYPYLAMWIENTELLVKSKSHDRSGQHSE